jgi:rRNA-processing protein FCF1
MKILLDTNFILTCAKNKLDFGEAVNEITSEPIEWIVPQDVLNELGTLKDRKGMKTSDKEAASLGFELLQIIKPEIIEMHGQNPNVDIKIVNYIMDKDIILATMDKNLKSRVKNKILTIRGKNNFEFL